MQGNVLVAQGGGPTAVINQSLAGVVCEARRSAGVREIYGAIHGVRGIVDEDLVNLTRETVQNLEMVALTPSAALGSTRDKPDQAYCKQIFRVLQAHEVGCFFYIGGNDSADTVRIVSEEARKASYDLRCVHIPKTIDNDLMGSDHVPGYPSAARFVVQAFMGLNLDNRSLPGVYVAVCVVAVSEGIHDAQGTPVTVSLAKQVERDAHGNVQLSGTGLLADSLTDAVKSKLGIKRVRGDTFGYLQRSFFGCVSDVDRSEAREVGEKAVHYAISDKQDGSVSIQRTGCYAVDYRLTDLAAVGGKTRTMPDSFITAGGNGVTDAFHAYLRPLLGADLPQPHRLRLNPVEKILKKN